MIKITHTRTALSIDGISEKETGMMPDTIEFNNHRYDHWGNKSKLTAEVDSLTERERASTTEAVRLQAEVKRLKELLDKLQIKHDTMMDNYKGYQRESFNLQAEVERLKDDLDRKQNYIDQYNLTADTCRCECVKWNDYNGVTQCHRCGRTITPPKPVVWVRKAKSRGDYFRVWQNGALRFSQYHSLDCWRTIYEDIAEVRIWKPTTCPTCGQEVKP